MHFVDFSKVLQIFNGRSVAIVGSGPSSLSNDPEFIDKHDLVVRVNNYKLGLRQGYRCDVHYAFYGTSIKKTAGDLMREGVTLCMCKCPNSRPIDSPWHVERGKLEGIDYRYIYHYRKDWWFCDTFVPTDDRFLKKFELLERHQPTTGFSAILDIVECAPKSIYLTGFDFFTSGIHNVDEPWKHKNTDDPICHRPDLELQWIARNHNRYPLLYDSKLATMVSEII